LEVGQLRLAIVTNILPPYRVPLFNHLARQPGVDLRVFLCATTEPNRHWEWPSDICFEYEIGSKWTWSPTPRKTIYLNPGLIRRLRLFAPDVVISGGMNLVSLLAWLGARSCGARFLLWAEGMAGVDDWLGRLMRPLRVGLVRGAHGYVASSRTAAEIFCALGADPQQITISQITLDVATFASEVSSRRADRQCLRQALGLTGPTILYVGQLEHYKGVDLLLETFQRLLVCLPTAELVLVGTGAEQTRLKEAVLPTHRSQIHFVGFKQPNELPLYYAVADLFCLFSRREPFGIVVTEAIAASLPVMCSKFAGAAFDLVEPDRNGYIIDPEEIEANASLMSKILLDDSLRTEMGQRSVEIAQKCTVEEAATSMLNAVLAVLS
jgi:glycosyltransferase involved in cell wall biosynthesis